MFLASGTQTWDEQTVPPQGEALLLHALSIAPYKAEAVGRHTAGVWAEFVELSL